MRINSGSVYIPIGGVEQLARAYLHTRLHERQNQMFVLVNRPCAQRFINITSREIWFGQRWQHINFSLSSFFLIPFSTLIAIANEQDFTVRLLCNSL